MIRKAGKNIEKARAAVEKRAYKLGEAVPLLQKVKFAKFDETVDLTMRLGVDPKHADQMVRGTVVLPHGLGKSKRVLVIANAEKQREASEAGADVIGGDELGIIHAPVGKMSFPAANLIANAHSLVDSVVKARPAAAKGKYLKSVTVSSTMGPGVRIDTTNVEAFGKR